jgi:hypothetical protein
MRAVNFRVFPGMRFVQGVESGREGSSRRAKKVELFVSTEELKLV